MTVRISSHVALALGTLDLLLLLILEEGSIDISATVNRVVDEEVVIVRSAAVGIDESDVGVVFLPLRFDPCGARKSQKGHEQAEQNLHCESGEYLMADWRRAGGVRCLL